MIDYNSFFQMQYGLYVVSSSFEGQRSGYICNAIMQITSTPCQVMIVSHKNNFTTSLIQASKRVAYSVLSENTPIDFIRLFGYQCGRTTDKIGMSVHTDFDGLPIVKENSVAYFAGNVIQEHDFGTHIGFVVEIQLAESTGSDDKPLTYSMYREKYRGASSVNSPTFVKRG